MSGSVTIVEPPAESALQRPSLVIRQLNTIDDFMACVQLQRTVWQWNDLDLMPVRLFVLHQQVGGVVLGAYESGTLVGFVNSIPGLRDGRPYWHSHMMAVLPQCQNRGIGTALKLAQRDCALARGVGALQWFFDPLQPRSAYLNLVKLGAVGRRYSINHYGPSSSPLHGGPERDLVLALWRLDRMTPRFTGETRRIAIPTDFNRLKSEHPAEARRVHAAVRAAFAEHLANGFVAVDLERQRESWAYVLRREPDPTEPHMTNGRST